MVGRRYTRGDGGKEVGKRGKRKMEWLTTVDFEM